MRGDDLNFKDEILSCIEKDREKIINFCAELVRCNTSSSHGDTRSAANLIKEFLDAENIKYQEISACKTMPNIISTTEMAQDVKHLMLNGHLDVMPAGNEPGWSVAPYSGMIKDGKIIGRGTSDMKAGVTAMIFAYKYLQKFKSRLSGRLSLTLVSDEETGWGRGTGFLFKKIPEQMKADSVLTAEPSGIDAISFSSKGYIQITVKIATRGAISGYSNESKSAIEVAADLIRDLKKLENFQVELPKELHEFLNQSGYRELHEKIRGKGHLEQLQRVTVDICTIKGGSLSTVIAADCKFTAAIVIPLGIDVNSLISKIRSIVEKYSEAKLTIDGVDLPEMSPPDSELTKILSDTVVELGKTQPVLTPDIAISDCRYWRYLGIPAYWYGLGGELCSAADEFVLIEDLIHVTKVHTLTVLKYLSINYTK